MRRLTAGLVVLALPWVAACSARPPERDANWIPAAPDEWTAARSAATETDAADPVREPERWWESFGDPRLDELIDAAMNGNRDLRIAAARLQQAEAVARIAGAPLTPSVSIGANGRRSRQVFVGLPLGPNAPSPVDSLSTQWGVSLDTSWEIDLWGRLHANARAALAQFDASRAETQAAALSIAAQTAKAWFAVAEAGQQADLARRSADSFGLLADQIERRYRLGVRPSIELRLARSNATAAEAVHAQRQAQLDGATRQLEVLIGEYPAASLRKRLGGDDRFPALPPPVPAGIPADVISQRPDLFAAERRLLGSEEGLAAAKRNLYPRLNLTVSGGTLSDSVGDLLDGDFRVWSLIGGLVQPIFQGGRIRAEIARTDGVRNEAAERFASAVLQAYGEVERSLAAEQYLHSAAEQLRLTARELAAARELAEDRYRSGVGDYLSVLESQTRSFNAESQLLSARRALLDNRINLHLALGGGFRAPVTPTDVED